MNEKKYSYKILPEVNLVIRCFIGDITMLDIWQSLKDLANEDAYSPEMNIMSDIQNANIQFIDSDIKELLEDIKSNKNMYAKRKSVLLTTSSNHVVFGALVDLLKDEELVEFTVVSTLDTAVSKLELPRQFIRLLDTTLSELEAYLL